MTDKTPAVDLDAIRARLDDCAKQGCTKYMIGGCFSNAEVAFLLGMVDTLTAYVTRANYMLEDAHRQIDAAIEDRKSFRAATAEWNRQWNALTAERDHHAEQASNILSHDIQLQHQVRTLTAALRPLADYPISEERIAALSDSTFLDEIDGVPLRLGDVRRARAALAGTSPTPPDVTDSGETLKSAAEISSPSRDLATLADQWTSRAAMTHERYAHYAAALRECAAELRAALGGTPATCPDPFHTSTDTPGSWADSVCPRCGGNVKVEAAPTEHPPLVRAWLAYAESHRDELNAESLEVGRMMREGDKEGLFRYMISQGSICGQCAGLGTSPMCGTHDYDSVKDGPRIVTIDTGGGA